MILGIAFALKINFEASNSGTGFARNLLVWFQRSRLSYPIRLRPPVNVILYHGTGFAFAGIVPKFFFDMELNPIDVLESAKVGSWSG